MKRTTDTAKALEELRRGAAGAKCLLAGLWDALDGYGGNLPPKAVQAMLASVEAVLGAALDKAGE